MRTEIEVEIVSKQQIKPSSPTPHYLHHFQLSFLDEVQTRISMTFVLFYPQKSSLSNPERLNILKNSLSETLTLFYPLAGRVKDNSHIDCNDEGVLFAEARANCRLSDVLENKYSSFQNYKFIPLQPDEGGDLAASFQVTFFKCGGHAISFAMSHKLGDALSQFIFLNCWAEVAKGNKVDLPPFGSAALFPPKKIPYLLKHIDIKENIAIRVFVFEAATISAIQAKYTYNGEKLSRVQALAAFIWSRFMAVVRAEDVNDKYMMVHIVNLRPRTVPPMPKASFGNLVWAATSMDDDTTKDIYRRETAKKMKDVIQNVNVDFVEKLQKSDDPLNFFKEKSAEVFRGQIVSCSFTSLCNFPTYEADFGWGKPEWVAMGEMFFKNLVIFLDAKDGESIEAWISLKEEEMAKFEIDDELLSHVSSSSNGKFHNIKLDAQSRL